MAFLCRQLVPYLTTAYDNERLWIIKTLYQRFWAKFFWVKEFYAHFWMSKNCHFMYFCESQSSKTFMEMWFYDCMRDVKCQKFPFGPLDTIFGNSHLLSRFETSHLGRLYLSHLFIVWLYIPVHSSLYYSIG